MHRNTIRPLQHAIARASACLAALGILSLAIPGAASAQLRGCDSTDAQCLDEVFSAACMRRDAPWPASCRTLLDEFMRYPDREREPEILAYAGLANVILGDETDDEAEAARYRSAARALYLQVIALDSDHSDAYLGLAQVADDPAERIDWLRLATRVSEPNTMVFRFLAGALESQETREGLLEAAAVMREAYEREVGGMHKWYLASWTFGLYSRLGLDAEAREFRDIVSTDIGIDELSGRMTSDRLDPESSAETMRILCDESVVRVVGPDSCIQGVERLFAAALLAEDTDAASRLAQLGLARMQPEPYGTEASDEPGDTVMRMVDWLERLDEAGIDSPELHLAMGRCYLDMRQSDAALDALRKASARADPVTRGLIEYYARFARAPDTLPSTPHFCTVSDTITVN